MLGVIWDAFFFHGASFMVVTHGWEILELHGGLFCWEHMEQKFRFSIAALHSRRINPKKQPAEPEGDVGPMSLNHLEFRCCFSHLL